MMDDCTLYHEMAFYVMQRKSQWKKIKNYKMKHENSNLKHLRIKEHSILYQKWSGKEKSWSTAPVCVTVFLHTNDVHICYNAVEVFEVFMIKKRVYFVVNFAFLLSSLPIIALLEHHYQCCDNVSHHYHLPKSVLRTKVF